MVGIGVCLPLVVILLSRKIHQLTDDRHCFAVWKFCRVLLKHSVILILIGSFLGFVMAGILWSDAYHERCHLVMTKFKWAAVEWATSMAIISMVLGSWRKQAGGRRAFWVRTLFLLIASLNLLYHLPILFMVLTSIPETQVQILTELNQELPRSDFVSIAFSGETLSRWLHAALAMIAASFVYTALQSIKVANQHQQGANRDSAISVCRWASRNVLILLFVQIGLGIWAALAMDHGRAQDLMGNVWPASLLFLISMSLLFIQLQQWTGLMSEQVDRKKLVKAIATFITMFICMTAVSVLI
ncbi:MAG: hypothetical protein CMJ76_16080 [Planctomycetaceae bacterium]|nr:hypothetical protein [Planctomycetaceae bacterium]|tara:strand:+ start:1146 stop:2045 length:900 start_codon:yes stop_codon:yes gene_type:complete